MATSLTYDEQVRNAMKIYHAVAVYKGQMWEDDEKQIAMMAMVEGSRVCKPQYSPATQAKYIQLYVRGRLQSWRKAMTRRYFESETWTDADGETQLEEAAVDPKQEETMEHREQCERVARAIQRLPAKAKETVEAILNSKYDTLRDKAKAMGISTQGFGNNRDRAVAMLREMVGEGNS